MDEQKLTAAFRAAADEAPEAGFSADDVRRESHRIGRRNRMLLTGGVAAAVIVLAGGVTTGVVLTRDAQTATSAAAPEAGADSAAAPDTAFAREAAPPLAAAPSAAPTSPLGPATGNSCVDPQDPELRAVVDAVLPEVATATPAPTTMICRPGGGREVNLQVTDGALTGLFSVVYTPPGEEPPQTAAAVSWSMAEVTTASGGLVTVTSRGDADSGGVPFGDRVETVAQALAPRL